MNSGLNLETVIQNSSKIVRTNDFHHELTYFSSNEVDALKHLDFVSPEEFVTALLRRLQLREIVFQPVFNMAAEYFTHLGVACECPFLAFDAQS